MKKFTQMQRKNKTVAVICAAVAAVVVLIIVISIIASGGSPEKTVNSFAEDLNGGNIEDALSCCAVDYKGFIDDAYSSQTVGDFVKSSYPSGSYTQEDFYNDAAVSLGGESASGASDIYKCYISSLSDDFKGKLNDFQIVETTDLDKDSNDLKIAVQFAKNDMAVLNKTGIDTDEYFDSSKISKAVKLKVSYTDENGSTKTAQWVAARISGSWKIITFDLQ